MAIETTNDKLQQIAELLQYAPSDFIDKVILRLQKYEKLSNLDL